MSVLIEIEDALEVDFSRAFVYPDACFMLAFLDSSDRRGDIVAELIDLWTNRDVTLGLSTHVYQEVVGVLFRNSILRSLEIQHLIHTEKKKILKLSDEEKNDLVDAEAAHFLYKVGLQIGMIDPHKSIKRLPVAKLTKSAKESFSERHLLQIYYSKAASDYINLITMLHSFNIHTEVLDANGDVLNTANSYTHLLQLDPADAVHYAIATQNQYSFFVTLDGDFSNASYERILDLKTVVIKVA